MKQFCIILLRWRFAQLASIPIRHYMDYCTVHSVKIRLSCESMVPQIKTSTTLPVRCATNRTLDVHLWASCTRTRLRCAVSKPCSYLACSIRTYLRTILHPTPKLKCVALHFSDGKPNQTIGRTCSRDSRPKSRCTIRKSLLHLNYLELFRFQSLLCPR